MRLLITAAMVSLLFGCATSFKPWKLSEVREGMSRAEVVGILGQPDSVENKNNAEYLYYTYTEELTPAPETMLDTPDGLQRRVEELGQTLQVAKYEVVLADGKVINYKQLRD